MAKRKMTVVLCILAALIALAAWLIYRQFHIYSAEDFGFEDIKSPNDADGDGIDDEVVDKVKNRHDIAKNIEAKIDGINSTRARAIARTEVKRANTVSNYIVAKERGATSYYVDCCFVFVGNVGLLLFC